MIAKIKQIRISPKKANLVAALVRRKNALEAMDILKFTPKKAAPIIRKLIESAVANADHNFKKNKENLVISEVIVSDGPTYKRRVCISRGRAHPILKRTSHITVKLEEIAAEKPKTAASSPAKAEAKKEEAKEEKAEKAEVKTAKAAPKTTKKTESKAKSTKK